MSAVRDSRDMRTVDLVVQYLGRKATAWCGPIGHHDVGVIARPSDVGIGEGDGRDAARL